MRCICSNNIHINHST